MTAATSGNVLYNRYTGEAVLRFGENGECIVSNAWIKAAIHQITIPQGIRSSFEGKEMIFLHETEHNLALRPLFQMAIKEIWFPQYNRSGTFEWREK